MEQTIENLPTQQNLPAPQPSTIPVISMVPAAEYAEQQKKAESDAKAKELATQQSSSLLSYMQRCLNEAVLAKQLSGVTDQLLESQRRRLGQHSAEKIAQLKKYGLPNYWVPVTQTKCIHTEAWFRDILMGYGADIWKLAPTKIPELQDNEDKQILDTVMQEATQHVLVGGMVSDQQLQNVRDVTKESYKRAKMEEAKVKASNMETLIQDQHEECDFRGVFREFQSNLTTYGTAFIKGPFTVKKKFPKWSGEKRIVEDRIIPSCSAPSPHDIYPAPWAKNEQDGYLIERIRTFREGLSKMRDMEYCQTKNIESLLQEVNTIGSVTIQYSDWQRNVQEQKAPTPVDNRIEVFQFNGPIPGYMLTDWGLLNCDPASEYNVEVLWSRNYILKVMPLWDEAGVRLYFKAVFKQSPGSFWGIGVPLLMSASQDRANAMMIALLDNTQWGTGTVSWIDQSRLVNTDDVKEMHSKKIIPTFSGPGQNGAPMGILEFPLHVQELSSLYERCLSDADNESGVPAYMYGSGAAGAAGGTFSGLSTLMNSSARGIKDGLQEIDQMLMKFIQHWADWNNEYSDDEDVKGDIRVICSGSTGLFVQEMQLQKLDELATQAKDVMALTGPRFVIDILRQKAKILKANDSLLPTDDELKEQLANSKPEPTPIKPSINISAKLELLPFEIQQALMGEIGVQVNKPIVPSTKDVSKTTSPDNPAPITPDAGPGTISTKPVTPVKPIGGQ